MVDTKTADDLHSRPLRSAGVFLSLLTCGFAALHDAALSARTLDGFQGITNGWPLWRDDHPVFFYYGLTAHSYLARTGTNAGYDPTFMAGYAKCIYFPQSSNFLELVMTAFGRFPPDVVYKLFVLITAGLVPWLFILAARLWRIGRVGETASLFLVLVYIWTDFPIGYINYGMLAYFLGIPLGLVALGAFDALLRGATIVLVADFGRLDGELRARSRDDGDDRRARRGGDVSHGDLGALVRVLAVVDWRPADSGCRVDRECVLVGAGNLADGGSGAERFRLRAS